MSNKYTQGKAPSSARLMGVGHYAQLLAREDDSSSSRGGGGLGSSLSELEEFEQAVVCAPWRHKGDGGGGGSGEPRFLCDNMLEGLARHLRLCGIDAASAGGAGPGTWTPPNSNATAVGSAGTSSSKQNGAGTEASSSGGGGNGNGGRKGANNGGGAAAAANRLLGYRRLVERAEGEGRVLLTCDRVLFRAKYTDQIYFIRSAGKGEQLREVLSRFEIEVKEEQLLSRCSRCNGEFLTAPVPAADLPPGVRVDVPAGVLEKNYEFWLCSNRTCSKVYW
jgi:uncharacterized protein with PIN domain